MRETELLQLLGQLVSHVTVNDPERGVRPSREAADFIAEWLLRRGLSAEIVESGGYYSVFGILGREPPCVGLLAHFDTVPVSRERWSYDPFKLTVVEGKAYGRGALDDKSNVASIMVALEDLSKLSMSCGVVYAFTGDEEIGGRNGAYVISQRLAKEGILPKYLINGDGAGMAPIVRRRKSFSIEISVASRRKTVRGIVRTVRFSTYYPVSQHSHAAYFIGGSDSHPLISASVLIREVGGFVRSLRGTFLKSNVIPPEVEVEYVVPDPGGSEVDVDEGLTELLKAVVPITRTPIRTRAFSEYGISATPNVYSFTEGVHRLVVDVRAMSRREDVEEAVKQVLEVMLPEASYSIRTDPGDYVCTPPSSRVVQALLEALRAEGVEARPIEGAGASDSRYFAALGVEVVDVGPRGGGMHGDDEYVELGSLFAMPKVYTRAVRILASP